MRHLLPRSTFGLAVLASVALSVATIGFGTFAYHAAHEALEEQLDHRITAESLSLRAEAQKDGPLAIVAAITWREAGEGTDGMGYMLFGPDQRKIAGRMDAALPEPGRHEFVPLRGGGFAQALVTPLAGGYTLVVAAHRAPVDEMDRTVLGTFAMGFGGMLAVGIGCAWALGLVVRRRLQRIGAAAQAIIDGDLDHRIDRDRSANEFDRVSEILNRMLDRNQLLLDDIRQVSSDIAHDLRTPLARQKQVLDAALTAELDTSAYRETIRVAAEAGQEILELFAALLRISEIDTHRVRQSFQTVDLDEVAQRVVEAFQADAEESGHALRCDLKAGLAVAGDRRLIAQMIANLVENALLHTPEGTEIGVILSGDGGAPVLAVADNGPGVAREDREKMLKRFVRLDASRSTAGHGLGMSLVAAIARAHGADLCLDDNAPGLRVEVRFSAA